MRAILSEIEGGKFPTVRTSEVTIRDWKDYSKLLGCDLFTVVSVDYNGEILSVFIDDEGLLKHNYGRMIGTYPEPLFGNIIVMGSVDSKGDTMALPESITVMQIDSLISDIKFETRG